MLLLLLPLLLYYSAPARHGTLSLCLLLLALFEKTLEISTYWVWRMSLFEKIIITFLLSLSSLTQSTDVTRLYFNPCIHNLFINLSRRKFNKRKISTKDRTFIIKIICSTHTHTQFCLMTFQICMKFFTSISIEMRKKKESHSMYCVFNLVVIVKV